VNGNERECAGVNGNQRGRFAFRTRAELALWVAWSRGGARSRHAAWVPRAHPTPAPMVQGRGDGSLSESNRRELRSRTKARSAPAHSRSFPRIPFTPAYSRSFPRNPVHSRAIPFIPPPVLPRIPFTPAQSRSLPRNPVHSRAIPFIPAHSRSLPRTPVHSRSFPFPPANPALLSRLDTECMGDTIHQNTTRSRPRSSACSCASTPPAECRSTGRSSTK
jgi:hypothetical protein